MAVQGAGQRQVGARLGLRTAEPRKRDGWRLCACPLPPQVESRVEGLVEDLKAVTDKPVRGRAGQEEAAAETAKRPSASGIGLGKGGCAMQVLRWRRQAP